MDSVIDLRLDVSTRVIPLSSAGSGASRTAPCGEGLCDPGIEPLAGRGEIVWFKRQLVEAGFTARDRSDLQRWAGRGDRAVVYDEEPADFAMLYEGSRSWSSWAVARQDGSVVIWDCVTFADIGRFRCMADALAAVSEAEFGPGVRTSNILAFAPGCLTRHEGGGATV